MQSATAGLEFDVSIDKDCDTKVVQVPDNPADPIDCTITVENKGQETLTNCVVSDDLTGLLALPSTLTAFQVAAVATQTTVTDAMIAVMTVTNTATITCDTVPGFDPVSASVTASIEVRSVDGDVEKNCTPKTQQAPGTIDWDWTVTNTSPDGKSNLDVSCDGFSTLNDPEVQDDLGTVLAFDGTATNMWTESGLAGGTYENEITCTFTAQDDRPFERMAFDSCEVETIEVDIHVLKFNDLNVNGEHDPGEEGIPGWVISLVCVDDNGNILLSTASTDDEGMVGFVNIPVPNQCTVFEEQRNGWTPTTPTSVTVELNSADDKEVTFGNVRALETEKFYTETEIDIEAGDFGVKLPFTDDDTQTVQAVIHPKTGKINSYNPGQYYAVTKVTAFVDLATVSIFEEDFDCTVREKPISIWNPAKVPGGAYVAMMCPDGTTVDLTSELANADPPQLFRNDLGVLEATVEDVKAGCMVFLGVKYSPGLKGFSIDKLKPQDLFCENVEIVCANLTDEGNDIPNPDVYGDMIACIADVTDSAHRVLEVVKCGENEEEDPLGDCVCKPGFVETPSGICVAGEI